MKNRIKLFILIWVFGWVVTRKKFICFGKYEVFYLKKSKISLSQYGLKWNTFTVSEAWNTQWKIFWGKKITRKIIRLLIVFLIVKYTVQFITSAEFWVYKLCAVCIYVFVLWVVLYCMFKENKK